MRDQVKWFAEQMEAKLAENDHKDGWQDCRFDYLLTGVQRETMELARVLWEAKSDTIQQGFDEGSIDALVKECADVANFAMMIADNARRLSKPPISDSITDIRFEMQALLSGFAGEQQSVNIFCSIRDTRMKIPVLFPLDKELTGHKPENQLEAFAMIMRDNLRDQLQYRVEDNEERIEVANFLTTKIIEAGLVRGAVKSIL